MAHLDQLLLGNHEDIFEESDKGQVDDDLLSAAVFEWQNVIPAVTVANVEDSGV